MYIKQKSVTFVNRAVLLKTVVLQPQPFFKIVRDLGILVGIRKMLCSCDCSLRSRRAHTGACTTDRSKFSKKMCLNLKEYFQFCPILKIMNFQSSFHLIFKSWPTVFLIIFFENTFRELTTILFVLLMIGPN